MIWGSRLTRPLYRLALRSAAHRYAHHSWPVIPGARLCGARFDCGEPGCLTIACHPAISDWEAAATLDRAQVASWWHRVDHGVLLATGRSFDVLELASAVGRQVAREIAREVRGPVALAPPQRWMFLVRPGGSLRSELAGMPSVVLHRAGSWIPAPPTALPTGQVRWETRPGSCGWRLPDPDLVQRAAVRALDFDRQPRRVWWPVNRAAVPSAD